jgi:hypothetical protein
LGRLPQRSLRAIAASDSAGGATGLRRPVFEVEAELAAAQRAQKEAKKAARKELHAARREHAHDDVKAKVDELKTEFGRGGEKEREPAPAAS